MADYNQAENFESLAASIGENVYIDVAKWHLYLADAHLHTELAQKLLPLLAQGSVTEDELAGVLEEISVKLGGGKIELPLKDLIPMQSQLKLLDLLEEYAQG